MTADKIIQEMWSALLSSKGDGRKATPEEREALAKICTEIEEWLADDEPHAMLDPEKFNV